MKRATVRIRVNPRHYGREIAERTPYGATMHTIQVCRRAVSDGGTLAKDIDAGDVIDTHAGKLKVGEVGHFMSEGTPMVRLDFPAFPGFPSYRAVMPETTDVAVDQGEGVKL